ncbi:MAG TPA: aminoacyl-tRNA hydrolase [Hyphomicrobiaceae bacterium]|jgi:PTH1 family peptidyl-tRNA hydrolase
MKLFVGLGNPGRDYARHRHNVGFMALERIAERHGLGPWKKRYHGLVTEGPIGGRRAMLLMPQTYMNDSGQAVGEAQRYLKIAEGDIYVFHDEIDLAPGKLKVKVGGGNAGHNGLRSISAHVGNAYARVRIGVGHPGAKEKVIGYVLHDFSKADRAWLEPMLDAVAHAAGRLAEGDGDRFATDVTRRLQGVQAVRNNAAHGAAADPARSPTPAAPPGPASRAAKVADAPSRAGTPSAAAGQARPARPQRGGSLADHLKRWLRGRG